MALHGLGSLSKLEEEPWQQKLEEAAAPVWELLLRSGEVRQAVRRSLLLREFPHRPSADPHANLVAGRASSVQGAAGSSATAAAAGAGPPSLLASSAAGGSSEQLLFTMCLRKAMRRNARARATAVLRAAADGDALRLPVPRTNGVACAGATAEGGSCQEQAGAEPPAPPAPPRKPYFARGEMKSRFLLREGDRRSLEHAPEVQGWLLRFWDAMPKVHRGGRTAAASPTTGPDAAPAATAAWGVGVGVPTGKESPAVGSLVRTATFVDLHVRIHHCLLYRGLFDETALMSGGGAGCEEAAILTAASLRAPPAEADPAASGDRRCTTHENLMRQGIHNLKGAAVRRVGGGGGGGAGRARPGGSRARHPLPSNVSIVNARAEWGRDFDKGRYDMARVAEQDLCRLTHGGGSSSAAEAREEASSATLEVLRKTAYFDFSYFGGAAVGGGNPRLIGYDTFCDALYGTLDAWTQTVSPAELCQLCAAVYDAVVPAAAFPAGGPEAAAAMKDATATAAAAAPLHTHTACDLALLSPYEKRLLGIDVDADDAASLRALRDVDDAAAEGRIGSPSEDGTPPVSPPATPPLAASPPPPPPPPLPGGEEIRDGGSDETLRGWMASAARRLERPDGGRVTGGAGGGGGGVGRVRVRSPDCSFVLERVVMERTASTLNSGSAIAGKSALLKYLSDSTINEASIDLLHRTNPVLCRNLRAAIETARSCGGQVFQHLCPCTSATAAAAAAAAASSSTFVGGGLARAPSSSQVPSARSALKRRGPPPRSKTPGAESAGSRGGGGGWRGAGAGRQSSAAAGTGTGTGTASASDDMSVVGGVTSAVSYRSVTPLLSPSCDKKDACYRAVRQHAAFQATMQQRSPQALRKRAQVRARPAAFAQTAPGTDDARVPYVCAGQSMHVARVPVAVG